MTGYFLLIFHETFISFYYLNKEFLISHLFTVEKSATPYFPIYISVIFNILTFCISFILIPFYIILLNIIGDHFFLFCLVFTFFYLFLEAFLIWFFYFWLPLKAFSIICFNLLPSKYDYIFNDNYMFMKSLKNIW